MKNTLSILCSLFLFSLSACGGSQTKVDEPEVSSIPGIPNSAVAAFNDGVRNLKATPPNYPGALKAFNKAAKLHPTYRVARLNSAICLEKTGQYRQAAEVYEALVEDYVEDPNVFMAYGNALLLSGQTGLAIEQFEKVVSLDDANLEAKNNLAAAYLRKGEPERSREFVKEVLAVQPDNVPALINLGLYYQRKKNMELAMLMFNNALSHENAKGKPITVSSPADSKKPKTKAQKGKSVEKASKSKKDEPKLKPGKPDPMLIARAENNLGMVWFQLGVIPNAVHHFKRAVSFDPSMNEARMNLASIYLDYLAYANALVEFQTVLGSNPIHYEAMIGTADALYGTAKYQEAATLFEKSFTLDAPQAKTNVEAMNRLAAIYHRKLNNPQKAMATYGRVQTDLGLSATDKAYKKAGQMVSSIKVEIQAAKTFAEQDKKATDGADTNAESAPAADPSAPSPDASSEDAGGKTETPTKSE